MDNRDWMRSSEYSPPAPGQRAVQGVLRKSPPLFDDVHASVVSVSEIEGSASPSPSPPPPRAPSSHVTIKTVTRESPAIASVVSASPSLAPAVLTIPLHEHDRKVQALRALHEAEMKRGESVHARACGEFAGALEDVRAQRDTYRDRCEDLLTEVERVRRRTGAKFSEDMDALVQEKSVFERRVTDLLTDREKLQAECDRLKFEVDRLYELSRQQDSEARRAFQDVKKDHEQLSVANRELAKRLQEATIEFQALDKANIILQEHANIGKTRFSSQASSIKEKERQLHQARRHAETLATLHEVCFFYILSFTQGDQRQLHLTNFSSPYWGHYSLTFRSFDQKQLCF